MDAKSAGQAKQAASQQWMEQSGRLLISFSHDLGSYDGILGGRVTVKAHWGMTPGTPNATTKSAVVDVQGRGEYDETDSTWIDLDEIPGLLEGIEFMRNAVNSWPTSDPDFARMTVSCRTGLQIGTASINGTLQSFVGSGGPPRQWVFMNLMGLPVVSGLLAEAADYLKER